MGSFSRRADGAYIRAIGQVKRQQAENLTIGVRRDLDSALVGPELGWMFRVYHGLYLAPCVGALYCVKSPQGEHNRPSTSGDALTTTPSTRCLNYPNELGFF